MNKGQKKSLRPKCRKRIIQPTKANRKRHVTIKLKILPYNQQLAIEGRLMVFINRINKAKY